MATFTDMALAAGIMIVFLAFIISSMVGYINSYTGIASTSELQGVAKSVFNSLFTTRGVPGNWEGSSTLPLRFGLATDLYRMPIVVRETNGTERGNVSVNVTVIFDSICANTTIDTTIVLYDSNNTHVPVALFNKTSCPGTYLKQSDIVFFLTLNASQSKTFYIYYSPDTNVIVARPTIAFPTTVNYSATVYPPQQMTQVSAAKILAMNSTNYTQFRQTIGSDYRVNITITKP
jgi:hypothetical protein